MRLILLGMMVIVGAQVQAFNQSDRMDLQDFGKMKETGFFTMEGKRKTIKSYKGKYVLMTFWATWCRACVSEIQFLEKLARQFKHDDLAIVMMTRNYPSVPPVSIQTLRLKAGLLHLEFLTDIDAGELHKAHNISALPTTLLIDRGGRVIGRLEGAVQWDHRDFIRFFQNVVEDKIKPENHESFWQKFGKLFR